MSGVSIRNREETDLPQCVEALAEVHDIDRYPIVWPEHPAQWISPSGLLRAWVAEQDRKVVGHIALVDECDLPEGSEPGCGPPLALISRLYVTPSARRQAAGAQLLNHAQTWAMAEGYSLMLEVAELGDHAAIALYERSGWHHVSSATASWTTPESRPVTLRYYRLRPGPRRSRPRRPWQPQAASEVMAWVSRARMAVAVRVSRSRAVGWSR